MGVLAGLATAGCGVAIYRFPTHRSALASAWLGVIGALALYRLVAAVWDANPPAPSRSWRSGVAGRAVISTVARARSRAQPGWARRPVPAELARVEGLVTASLATAGGVHRRLRPLAREIAGDRLGLQHGLRMDSDGDAVRRAVGDPLWDLIRPDRTAPADSFARGLTLAELDVLVSALERLG